MMEVNIEELSMESFRPFGSFAAMIDPDSICIGAKPVEFFRDMITLNLGQNSIVSFSICRVEKREPVIDTTEYHSHCGEGIMPIDGDVLIHVAPATPNGETPYDRIRVFRVPRGTMVVLNPGVWHHAPFAYGSQYVNTLIALPERAYANDCSVVTLEKTQHVGIRQYPMP